MFKKLLNMQLPLEQSAFLWGARNTGKSTYLHQRYPQAIYYDLLQTDVLHKLLVAPHLLREELLAVTPEQLHQPVVIDEVQKIPVLLNEIHWLIENKKIGFILCGSSARKLKRGAANLLGGRAWSFNFYPLVYKEIPDFDLLRALNHGLLPTHYLSDYPERSLRAYVNNYLKEEIQAEGLVRNLAGFARFLDIVGFSHGEILNYANIARDCGVDAKTVKEYYQILVDTLIGYHVHPFFKKVKRDLITAAPKFYLFDVGVANFLIRKKIEVLQGLDAGKAFEHFIFMEIQAYLGLHELDYPLNYWRSKTGLEVDFVINQGETAIEVKISVSPQLSDLTGLSAFCADYHPKHALVVCQANKKRQVQTHEGHSITILPWQEFLENLWDKQYF
ncbi:MAG: DUF4143 domain-containing protein [Gammaproteobacteria bacterium]